MKLEYGASPQPQSLWDHCSVVYVHCNPGRQQASFAEPPEIGHPFLLAQRGCTV